MYLANVSLVSDVEIFKICLEYWNIIVRHRHTENTNGENRAIVSDWLISDEFW